jgi:hypothetical protein
MTNQHRATPEQWDSIERCADGSDPYSCILELRGRIEALEAAQQPRAFTGKVVAPITRDRDETGDYLIVGGTPSPTGSPPSPYLPPRPPMPDPDYKALCAELEDAYTWCIEEYMTAPAEEDTLIQCARAALAQPGPVAPTDEELLELLSRVSGLLDYDAYIVDGGRIMSEPNELLAYARAVLARWGTPAIAAELEGQ